MLDLFKRLVNNQEQECEPLDPYLVGRIAGPAAFATGDWVVIRCRENTPGRVIEPYSSDFSGAIRIVIHEEVDFDIERCYVAGDLGYPLTKDLWSRSQLEWYQKCHEERHFINLAKSFSTQPKESKRPNNRFEEYIEKHRSNLFSVFLFFVLWGILRAMFTFPHVAALYALAILVIVGPALLYWLCR